MNKILNGIVERAIKHEKECQCSKHVNGRRLSDAEITAVRMLFSTWEGYAIIMGIVTAIMAEVPGMSHRVNIAVIEHIDNPTF